MGSRYHDALKRKLRANFTLSCTFSSYICQRNELENGGKKKLQSYRILFENDPKYSLGSKREEETIWGFSQHCSLLLERMRIFPAQDKCNFLCGISLFLSKNRGGQKPRTLLMVGTHLAVFLLLTLSYE